MAARKKRGKRKKPVKKTKKAPAKDAGKKISPMPLGRSEMLYADDLLYSSVKLFALVTFFSFSAILLYYQLIPQKLILAGLAMAAIIWFAVEGFTNRKHVEYIKRACYVGVFLLAFDFVFENAGWLAGLWATHNSIIAIGVVPLEVMLICLFGGAAWAMYLPRHYNRIMTLIDILTFATFGALGEYLLGINGLMTYFGWWNSGWAFLAYAMTWIILHLVRYAVFNVGDAKK